MHSLRVILCAVVVAAAAATVHAGDDQSWNQRPTYLTWRTMTKLGISLFRYQQKHGAYPAAKSMTEVAEALSAEGAANIETRDRWGTELRYVLSNDGKSYELISAGADRKFDESSWDRRETLGSADDDAVMRDGEWIRAWDEKTAPGKGERVKPAAQVLLDRADALRSSLNHDGALDAYMEAVKIDPAAASLAAIERYGPPRDDLLPPPPPGVAVQHYDLSKTQAALRQYLRLHPGDWDATRALVTLVDLAEGESLLEPFFKSRPRDPEVFVARANLRARHHADLAAIDDEAKAAELDPQNADRYSALGLAAYHTVSRNKTLTTADRKDAIRRGIAAFRRAEALREDDFAAMGYHSLLLRQQALLETDPNVQQKLTAEADALRARSVEIMKKAKAQRAQ